MVVWSGSFPDAVNPGVDAVLSALEALAPDPLDHLHRGWLE
jgi:hypothetical protein